MTLFPDRLLQDIQRLPGGRHSFLTQVCAPEGRKVRLILESLAEQAGEPLAGRARETLTSFDNRKFFQGYSELVTASLLARGGARVRDLVSPGPLLVAHRPTGAPVFVSVLSYIHKFRPIPDRATVRRLCQALDRIASQERLLVIVHRWLPHDLDTGPIRRAVEIWLSQVASGAWEGRYATYEDDRISLEFGLTGQKASRRGRRVVMSLGPFFSPASLTAVESRVLGELEAWRVGAQAGAPLVVACVADQPWRITQGYMTDFLYGRPRRMEMFRDGDSHNLEMEFGSEPAPCLFRDPLYQDLAAFLWVGRDPVDPTLVHARAFLNPWARVPVPDALFPTSPVLCLNRWDQGRAVVSWLRRGSGPYRLL